MTGLSGSALVGLSAVKAVAGWASHLLAPPFPAFLSLGLSLTGVKRRVNSMLLQNYAVNFGPAEIEALIRYHHCRD